MAAPVQPSADTIELIGPYRLLKETGKMYLIDFDGQTEWLPVDVVRLEFLDSTRETCNVVMPQGLAEERDLI